MEELQKQQMELSLSNITQISDFGKVLKSFIVNNKLSCNFKGKEYAYCDAWKFAGINFGLTAIPEKPINESKEGETKYTCECNIIRIATGEKMSYGFALCSNKEVNKKSLEEYAIASTAQTRAIAKAYRNLLGFIMNAAGYEGTPAEEMDSVKANESATGTAGTQEQPAKKWKEDNRPWLSEKQLNQALERIMKGEADVVQKTKDAFRMKKTYRADLENAKPRGVSILDQKEKTDIPSEYDQSLPF